MPGLGARPENPQHLGATESGTHSVPYLRAVWSDARSAMGLPYECRDIQFGDTVVCVFGVGKLTDGSHQCCAVRIPFGMVRIPFIPASESALDRH